MIATFVGVLSAAAIAILFLTLLTLQQISYFQDEFDYMEVRAEELRRELTFAVRELARIGHEPCSPEFRSALLATELQTSIVKDIGFLRDDWLLCTSTMGRLPEPIPPAEPDIVTKRGWRIWVDVPLAMTDMRSSAHVLSQEDVPRFNFVVGTDVLELGRRPNSDSAIHILDRDGSFVRLRGREDLPAPMAAVGAHFTLRRAVVSLSGCFAAAPAICVTFGSGLFSPFRNSAATGVLMLIAAILGVASAKGTYRFLRKCTRFRHRFWRGFGSDRFVNAYQPIVDHGSGRIVGCEVLARWRDENGRIRYPDRFLHHVKAARRTREMLGFIVGNAFADLPACFTDERVKVSFNVTANDFHTQDLVALFAPYQRKHPGFQIYLELVEDELGDIDVIRRQIRDLHNHDIKVSIDDFGTGYSSLSYLSELGADELKIDRSFLNDVAVGSIKSELVRRIIAIAKLLNMSCVVEGVESETQANWLAEAGADWMQGYLFAPPLERPALEAFLARPDAALSDTARYEGLPASGVAVGDISARHADLVTYH